MNINFRLGVFRIVVSPKPKIVLDVRKTLTKPIKKK